MHKELDAYLKALQEESPNWGGEYHFRKLELGAGANIQERLSNYFLQISAYKNPYIISDGKSVLIANRDIDNLVLTPHSDFKQLVNDKLKYWSEHETTMDRRATISEFYEGKETIFKEMLFEFLDALSDLKTYTIDGFDTSFAKELGGDHVSDDVVFESGKGIYVLHFGWSS